MECAARIIADQREAVRPKGGVRRFPDPSVILAVLDEQAGEAEVVIAFRLLVELRNARAPRITGW